ncbi:hypothetical protein BFW01_g12337 [Lasiodiplodia theobromae]|uniref:Uncharacterized protein n=2 Tax=Lasiodiplodia TaxID=66739 RepID=A0A5N5CXG9_9PEZI|nr:uncharacterized protein LTHEOB_12046 [Lasiodiplodia theobromae]KAB2570058.1 hypothetical protein DBV05_g11275 [Lasiodiplodia theobromae]KAF4536758.1 hypothetical protein LTHEOB_12046 [Lasiodiplodia theobromae]KAF9640531.1 hypothetical protein BFW01_g12337 [Lasiodiplodia theobromae]KAK0642332.1 hypothetical protein DIS24_g9189 [Lasiodiplodia hormozganensis]
MAATSAKPTLPALKTPVSATYPSELRSPQVATPSIVKREEGEKTPITPPAAYVDFLKALSPALMSPMPTGTSTKFTFEERPPTSRTSSASSATTFTSTSSAADKPASPASSSGSPPPDETKAADAAKTAATEMRVTIPPPSPFVRPMSARTPRLLIPQSPFSPALRTPLSARSLHSPYSATMSPGAWSLDAKTKDTRAVSVRQVVTRTVTYTRTPVDAGHVAPLDPAPKGKRRRIK